MTAMEALRSVAGKPIKPPKIKLLRSSDDESRMRFTIFEGRNREIRRICESVGLLVTRLVRVEEGELRLGNLPVGKWRELSEAELAYVKSLI